MGGRGENKWHKKLSMGEISSLQLAVQHLSLCYSCVENAAAGVEGRGGIQEGVRFYMAEMQWQSQLPADHKLISCFGAEALCGHINSGFSF